MSKHILITGGTGMIGSMLTDALTEKGYKINLLSRSGRSKKKNLNIFGWDIEKEYIDPEAFEGVDTIVHLAGAGVADKRWTHERKLEILNSRTESTRLLNHFLSNNPHQVTSVICASAIGIYGDSGKTKVDEDSLIRPADFLADVTRAWEEESDQFALQGLRLVKMRIGIVLSKTGGALEKMAQPVRLGVGAPLGSGEQYMSWIHIDDLIQMFVYAISNEQLIGTFNAVAPNPVTNKEFTKMLGSVLGKLVFLPAVPSFVLKAMLGEMALIVLGGSNVSADKIKKEGFHFKYENLKPALVHLLKNEEI
ncbi:MAG: TIGR01777 family oxidoreductase [Cyclobacteriaceae bacterium]